MTSIIVRSATIAFLILSAAAASAQTASEPITEISLPSNSNPEYVVAGPDGNVWFTIYTGVGKITPAGAVTVYPTTHLTAGIAVGPDNNIWFTSWSGNLINRITPQGTLTQFACSCSPRQITKGPDGNLWFNAIVTTPGVGSDAYIGRIAPADGSITLFKFPAAMTSFAVGGITGGPDGNVWFTLQSPQTSTFTPGQVNHIGRITPSGTMTFFQVPTPYEAPQGITTGPDGNLWFGELSGSAAPDKIGRITSSGTITEFALSSVGEIGPNMITTGPDGALWFTEQKGNKIGRFTLTGDLTEFPIPTSLTYGQGCGSDQISHCTKGLATGSDGNLWFAETINRLGRVDGTAAAGGGPPLVWRNTQTGDVNLWSLANGLVRSQKTLATGVPLTWSIAGEGDLDGNGTADVVWRNTQTGDVSVWLMTNASITGIPVIASGVPLAWQIAGIADLNGDGRADLVWRNTTTGDLSVWWMNGSSITGIPMIASGVPLVWQIAGFADLDGDGKADIVWRNTQTGDVAVWLMNAEKVKAVPVIAQGVPLSWQIAGLGDANGDGKADIVWRNTTSGDVAVWLMSGTAVLSVPVIAQGVPLEWTIRRVVDVDGDGKADLVFRQDTRVNPLDYLYGWISVWLLDGATVRQTQIVHAATITPANVLPPAWLVQ